MIFILEITTLITRKYSPSADRQHSQGWGRIGARVSALRRMEARTTLHPLAVTRFASHAMARQNHTRLAGS